MISWYFDESCKKQTSINENGTLTKDFIEHAESQTVDLYAKEKTYIIKSGYDFRVLVPDTVTKVIFTQVIIYHFQPGCLRMVSKIFPLVSHMIIFSAKNIRTEITSEAFSAKRDIEFIFMTSQIWKKSSLLLNTSSNFFFVNLSNPRPPAIIIMSGIRGFFY